MDNVLNSACCLCTHIVYTLMIDQVWRCIHAPYYDGSYNNPVCCNCGLNALVPIIHNIMLHDGYLLYGNSLYCVFP